MAKNELTPDQEIILERNRPLYEGLLCSGRIRQMSSVTLDQFNKIYSHVTGLRVAKPHCSACIIDIVEIIYRTYDERKKRNIAGIEPTQAISDGSGQAPERSGLPEPVIKTTDIRKRGRSVTVSK